VALLAADDFRPGQWLSLTARLDTPPAPSEPGASDLGRSLFFQSIGAVGFAYGRAHAVAPAERRAMRRRAQITLICFALAALAALAFPLLGLAICIACLAVYLRPRPV